MPTRPTAALLAVAVALAAAAAEFVASLLMTPAGSPVAPLAVFLAFLVGPLIFLAIMAWRRRSHPPRSRVLLAVSLVTGVAGVALLGSDLYRVLHEPSEKRIPHSNPVLLPVCQWALVLLVWVVLVVMEGQEKRRAASVGAGSVSDGKGGTRR